MLEAVTQAELVVLLVKVMLGTLIVLFGFWLWFTFWGD